MNIIDSFNKLVLKMDLYDLYQDDNEVVLAIKELRLAIQLEKDRTIINRLSQFLVANTNEQFLEMWEEIQKEENLDTTIDWVPFVITKSKFQCMFTCKQFIHLINL